MKIAIGADHAGFPLKEQLRQKLAQDGHEVVDHGTVSEQSCDYPNFAASVARAVAGGDADRGVLVCATGVGMSIAANKVVGARAAPATSTEEVKLTREHNDANILALGSRFVDAPAAAGLIDVFLATEFQGGRHARRVAQIAKIEQAEMERR